MPISVNISMPVLQDSKKRVLCNQHGTHYECVLLRHTILFDLYCGYPDSEIEIETDPNEEDILAPSTCPLRKQLEN